MILHYFHTENVSIKRNIVNLRRCRRMNEAEKYLVSVLGVKQNKDKAN